MKGWRSQEEERPISLHLSLYIGSLATLLNACTCDENLVTQHLNIPSTILATSQLDPLFEVLSHNRSPYKRKEISPPH